MKKILLTLCALLMAVSGAWGETSTGSITLTSANTEFLRVADNTLYYNNSNVTLYSYYLTRFASMTSPLVSLNQGGGNIQSSTFGLHSSTSGTAYTISMLAGYTITGYSITCTPAGSLSISSTYGTVSPSTAEASTATTIEVTDVNQSSVAFTLTSTSGSGFLTKISSITVNYSYETAPTMVQTMGDLTVADYTSCPVYTMTSERSALYVASGGSLSTVHAQSGDIDDARKQFAFIYKSANGNYYLYNVSEGKFVNQDKTLTDYANNEVSLHYTLNASYPQYIRIGSKYVNVQESGSTEGGVLLNTWGKADKGNSFVIEPASTADLSEAYEKLNGWTATYHINGTELTATGNVTYLGSLAVPASLKRSYCDYTFYSDAACTNQITSVSGYYKDIYVKYAASSSCPFTFSTGSDPTAYTYYFLQNLDGGYAYANGTSFGNSTTLDYTYAANDNYLWAFVGDPYGYTIYNKSGQYVYSSATGTLNQAIGLDASNYLTFELYQNSKNYTTTGFASIVQGSQSTGHKLLNYQGGYYLFIANSPTQITFTDNVKVSNIGGSGFLPTDPYEACIDLMLTNAKSYRDETGVGVPASDDDKRTYLNQYITGFEEKGWTKNEEYYGFFKDVYESFLACTNIVLPTDGKVYSFINVAQDGTTMFYLNDNNGTLTGVSYTEGTTVLPETAKFVCHVVDTEDTHKYVFVSNSGRYIQGAAKAGAALTTDPFGGETSSEAALKQLVQFTKFPSTDAGYVSGTSLSLAFGRVWMETQKGAVRVYSTNFIMDKSGGFDNASNAYLSSSLSTMYQVVEQADYYNAVTMNTVGEKTYATVYLPFSVTIPAKVKAYAATAASSSTMTLTKIADGDESGILPKNTAAILYGYDGTVSGTQYLSPAEGAGSFDGTNVLEGTVTDSETAISAGDIYVLYSGANGIGFYPSARTTYPLGKAYLPASSANGIKAFLLNFDEETTSINGITNQTGNDAPIFDLSGRRVEKAQRGIYIQNGKKFIVK